MTGTADAVEVLYVDDDPDLADLAAEALRSADDGFTVRTAARPDDALELLATEPVDCVVSDYGMPGRAGLDLLAAVRERHPRLPFIIHTGQGSEAVASDAIAAGVTDYLRKGSGDRGYAPLAARVRDAVDARRAEVAADRRRRRLEQVLQTVPSCVVQLDRDGEFVFANDRAMAVLGLTEADLTDRTYNDPAWDIRDEDGDPIPDAELPFRRVCDSGEPVTGARHTIEWPDGTRRTLSVNGAPLFNDDGDVESAVFALSDITDRVRRERDLRQYRHIVDAMNETACIYDPEGRYVVVNQRLAWMYDTTPEALAGRRSEFLATVRDRAEGDPFRELLDGDREEYRGELESEFGSYGTATVDYRLTPLVVEDGVTGVVCVVRDITERKRRERELEQARQEYEQLINGMNDAAWVIHPDGSFLAVNDAAVETTGYTRSELCSMRIEDIDATVEDPDAARLDTDRYDDGRRVFETVHETKAGERVPVEVSSSIVSYRGETAELSISRDISARKRRERRLEQFASVVSHDLRNPLNVAEGSVELAQAQATHDSEHLDRAHQAHTRMQALIDDLLTLARQGETVIDPEPVDLQPFVETCWQHVATDTAALRIADEETIRADQGRLRQLFENLFRNAVEHGSTSPRTERHGDAVEHGSTGSRTKSDDSSEHGATEAQTASDDAATDPLVGAQAHPEVAADPDAVTVTVGTLPGGFYVEDDGPGIPADDREAVFETGYSTAADGTGFGLSIVAQVADDHGWDVRVTDGGAGGARFEVTGVDHTD